MFSQLFSMRHMRSAFLGHCFVCLSLLFFTVACHDVAPQQILSADSSRGAAYGQDGIYGAGVVTRDFRIRVDDHNRVRLVMPITRNQILVERSFPLVVFAHGGLVSAERYDWLLAHIASRGFIVAAPEHPFDLPILATGNLLDVTDALYQANKTEGDWLYQRIDDKPAMIVGHSLGGVIASSSWLKAPGYFESLVLLASEPFADDDFSQRATNGDVLSLTGSIDALETPIEANAGVTQIRNDGVFVNYALIEGMNHYQWTQDYTVAEIEDDNEPVIDDEQARFRATFLLDVRLEQLKTGKQLQIYTNETFWPNGLLDFETYCKDASC